ncbi:MAG: heme-binding protein [Methyloprofundus sp.]|nr:heme-binding protein [Methyloprofundus sp.]
MIKKRVDLKSFIGFLVITSYLSFSPLVNAEECTGFCANENTFLTKSDVRRIIVQAVQESELRDISATIAVTDRVGNVLAAYQMGASPQTAFSPVVNIEGSDRGVNTGLEGVDGVVPASLVSIAKAITGAYLSSEGNAFSTRTASHIIQQNFNPQEIGQPAGPLFGVQFSSLPCSDLVTRFTSGVDAGPKRSPLGLSADPGGFPLYKNGTVVGGIGVEVDLKYGLDLNIRDRDSSDDERVALAGTLGFEAPENHRANRITVEGKSLRYSDARYKDIRTKKVSAVSDLSMIDGKGQLIEVPVYFAGKVLEGTAFGQANSGIRPASDDFSGLDAFVLVDNDNQERFPAKGGEAISRDESLALLRSALAVANSARAQIRQPLNSQARVTISLVDTKGDVLGVVRTRDAPVFGTDVSLQKARTAAFFSKATARDQLNAATDAIYVGLPTIAFPISNYVDAAISLFNDPDVLTGEFAFTDRAGGNLSRPFFPDGIEEADTGPFSKPFPEWSPFSTGLQLDLVINGILTHVAAFYGLTPDIGEDCTASPPASLMAIANILNLQKGHIGQPISEVRNGIQIFPGSVPVYRGNTLIGGLGVSGDGIDQDDLISFLGVHNAGLLIKTLNNAPSDIRADHLTPDGVRLRYVQCPYKPFLESGEQNACSGK